jgi:hypothetical protein
MALEHSSPMQEKSAASTEGATMRSDGVQLFTPLV